ncbi:hypothetical protein TNCV_135671 [Trichonephila clavipes]|nr:hypothetical protein TNCV_135671 [Trichonephila clavipes]
MAAEKHIQYQFQTKKSVVRFFCNRLLLFWNIRIKAGMSFSDLECLYFLLILHFNDVFAFSEDISIIKFWSGIPKILDIGGN